MEAIVRQGLIEMILSELNESGNGPVATKPSVRPHVNTTAPFDSDCPRGQASANDARTALHRGVGGGATPCHDGLARLQPTRNLQKTVPDFLCYNNEDKEKPCCFVSHVFL